MTGPEPPRPEDQRGVAELVFDVSERITSLVREEVALAKAEVTEKLTTIARGSVVAVAAGTFAFLGLILLMHSIAWLLNDLFFGEHFWIGFLIEALLFFAVAAAAGLFAYKAVKAGAPPTPEMAIEEGKRIRQTLDLSTTPVATEPVAAPAAPGSSEPVSSGRLSSEPASSERVSSEPAPKGPVSKP